MKSGTMNLRKLMTRYWFEFKSNSRELPFGIMHGCGVTAYDYNDALSILEQKVFKGQQIPEFKVKKENIDVRTLDQGHVIPNMKDPTLRGIWFPIGYE
jgi:hypothetical protein